MKYVVPFLLLLSGCSATVAWSPNLENTVAFSDEFSQEEKAYILHGFNVWERETNCKVSFVEATNAQIQIVKATNDEVVQFDIKHKERVIGLAELNKDPKIYFAFQRVSSFEELELVAAHEAGHHLGMLHVPQEQTAVMNPSINKALVGYDHLTQYDLDQFDNYWRCK